jgi:predicted nucleotidyltransferase
MKAFLTGSQIYGTPRPDSDIDLVVWLSIGDLEKVRELTKPKLTIWERISNCFVEKEEDEYHGCDSAVFRFGSLNLLVVTTEKAYNDWRDGTEELRAMSPVTREQAIETFRRKRDRINDDRAEDVPAVAGSGL